MISTLMKMSGARKAVQLLGGVEKDMEVLILHDPLTTANVEPLAIAANEVDARVTTMQMTPSKFHGKQLSPVIGEAMKAADLVIGLTYQNIAHTQARLDAQVRGTKVMVLPESDSDSFFLASGWDANFPALRAEIDALASAFTKAEQARVWSKDGTDITMSVAGREGRSGNGEVDIGAGYLVQPLAGVTCEDVRAPCPGRHRPGKAEQTHSSCSGSEKLASIDGDHKGLLTWRSPLLTRAPIQPLKVFRSAPSACCARDIRGFRSPFRSFREDRPPRPGYAPRWSRAQALRAALQAFARSRPERD